MQKLSFDALMTTAIYELYSATVVDGIQYISANALAERISDGVTPGYLIVALTDLDNQGFIKLNTTSSKNSSITPAGIRFVEKGLAKPDSDIARLRDNREDFTNRRSVSVKTAPASDRIVSLTHNGGPEIEVVEASKELRLMIRRGNDLGDLSPEEALAADVEIQQIEVAFSGKYLRSQVIFHHVQKTLGWLGEKAAGAAVGKAALALLALIATFFGISL